MSLTPLANAPQLNARAYEAIREAILSHRLQPGQMLSIGRLADELGVSRTPVRDALMQLDKEGLVALVPFKGALVTDISRKEVEDLYEFRGLLHGYAARLAATRLTAADLDRAQALLDMATDARQRGDPMSALKYSGEFHHLIVMTVDNAQIAVVLEELRARRARIRAILVALNDRLAQSDQQHRQILAALRQRDPDLAEQCMKEHLASTTDSLLEELDKYQFASAAAPA